MAPPDARPFMLTPLVIAMPKPMADALGYPDKPVGFADIAAPRHATRRAGPTYGHPEWGPFRLGKTNPNFSTSGLSALIAQTYAGVGKTLGPHQEDLANPAVVDFAKAIESSVVHYGDITLTFLNNWFRADQRGTALTYASAVAVEEKSVIDYNPGNPDGVLDPGEVPRKPRSRSSRSTPARARSTPTTRSSSSTPTGSPTPRRRPRQSVPGLRAAAGEPAQGPRVRVPPGNPDVAVGAPIIAGNGVDPDPAHHPARGAPAPGDGRPARPVGRATQGRPGPDRARRVGLDGRAREPGVGRDQARPGQDRRDRRRSTSSTPTTRWVCGSSRPSSDPTRTRRTSTSCRSRRSARTARSCADDRRAHPRAGTPLFDVTKESYRDDARRLRPRPHQRRLLLTDGHNDDGDPERRRRPGDRR